MRLKCSYICKSTYVSLYGKSSFLKINGPGLFLNVEYKL